MATERTDPAEAHRTFRDRRLQRLAIRPCEDCGSTSAGVTLRTEYVVYVRCTTCWHVWSLQKPGREPVGS